MDVRFGLKIGHIEMEFEGAKDVFEAKIEPIVRELVEFGMVNLSVEFPGNQLDVNGDKPKTPAQAMTVKSVAAKLGVKDGSSLVSASVASLVVLRMKQTVTRQEIHDEMKQAIGYYKTTYGSNLSSYLDTLVKQEVLIEVSKDVYAMKESERQVMEQKLAG
ncbi:hypothetical protein [Taklimakanibacter albus]|uniref:Uncharacterized protein n=1 Tax=Taklimakanibacter albus TaxID=2800327 RepID=A0ACC5R3R2_9HYPH|nr:hypothetical protein [Aestuariivirga sp. YIM B02566]MBK1867305.1 hypothetical protein [Aestuariivirga sp. YIM B02566]